MPEPIDLSFALGLSPEKAVEYFRAKGHKITFNWSDMWQQAHAKAFTVAKVAGMDVLQDLRGAVDKALAEGQTFTQFRDNVEPVLKAKGWWGQQLMKDPLTGEDKPVQLGSPFRLKTIYRQNITSALVAGDWNSAWDNREAKPYGVWHAVQDSHTRPSHMALDRKAFLLTDPFWKTHVPGHLGWGCRCYMTTHSLAELKRMGITPESSAGNVFERDVLLSRKTGEMQRVSVYKDPVSGAEVATAPGFSYNPAMAAWQPDLNAYDYAVARDYVQGTVTGPHFARFLAGKEQGSFPVAVLSEELRGLLGVKSQALLLDSAALAKNKAAHPEVKAAESQRLQPLIEQAHLIVKDGPRTLAFIKRDGLTYQAEIITTSDGVLLLGELKPVTAAEEARVRAAGKMVKGNRND